MVMAKFQDLGDTAPLFSEVLPQPRRHRLQLLVAGSGSGGDHHISNEVAEDRERGGQASRDGSVSGWRQVSQAGLRPRNRRERSPLWLSVALSFAIEQLIPQRSRRAFIQSCL